MATFGKNLKWFLGEVGISESEYIENGSVEVHGENDQGQDGSVEVMIPELALEAKCRIEKLESAVVRMSEAAEKPSESSMGVRQDIIDIAKGALEHLEGMTITGATMQLRVAIQDAEPFGLVRTENGQVITGASESEQGIVLTEN